MESKKPIRKTPYDWRDKVCQFCGVDASNGCCPRHQMNCPTCNGFGAISKQAWDVVWERDFDLRHNPPNKCCEECTDYFNHSVGSHSDDYDPTSCLCNENVCAFPYCVCHIKIAPKEKHLTNE